MSDINDRDDRARETILRPLRDGIDTARDHASEAAEAAFERAGKAYEQALDSLEHARETLGGAYESGRERIAEAYASARERTRSFGRSAGDSLDTSPITALLGGLAFGAVIGALLPRTDREQRLMGSIGGHLQGIARQATEAAKAAGIDKLDELGLSADKAREAVRTLIDGAITAATSAGSAAVSSTRTQTQGDEA